MAARRPVITATNLESLGNSNTYLHNNFRNFESNVNKNGVKSKIANVFNTSKRRTAKALEDYAKNSERTENKMITSLGFNKQLFIKDLEYRFTKGIPGPNEEVIEKSPLIDFARLKSGNFDIKGLTTEQAFKIYIKQLERIFSEFSSGSHYYNSYLTKLANGNNSQAIVDYNHYKSKKDNYMKLLEDYIKRFGGENPNPYTPEEHTKMIRAAQFDLGWMLEPLAAQYGERVYQSLNIKDATLTAIGFSEMSKQVMTTNADISFSIKGKFDVGIDVKSNLNNRYSGRRRQSKTAAFNNSWFRYAYMNVMYTRFMKGKSRTSGLLKLLNNTLAMDALANAVVGVGYNKKKDGYEAFVLFPNRMVYASDFFRKVANNISTYTVGENLTKKLGRITEVRTGMTGSQGAFQQLLDVKSKALVPGDRGYDSIIQSNVVKTELKKFYKAATKGVGTGKGVAGFTFIMLLESI